MTVSASQKSFCLHATSADLSFLKPVKTRLKRMLGGEMQFLDLGNQHSCADAKLKLRQAQTGFVAVMAHGTSSCIRSGEHRNRAGETQEGNDFLKESELNAFAGKTVFCLSCDSNCLAIGAMAAGARAFVGFDEVPFNRFDESGDPIGSPELVLHSRRLLGAAVTATLEQIVSRRSTLSESVSFLRYWICREAVRFVREQRGVTSRRDVAALFLKVKDGIRYYGPYGLRFGD
ncbi:MAG TPA: hypothetical protein VMM36_20185 [Opitutaceae bacterium]|nr:hypothetical protein [Opitutaceae bacterium]